MSNKYEVVDHTMVVNSKKKKKGFPIHSFLLQAIMVKYAEEPVSEQDPA
jgi:hypothetical protein